MTITPATWVTSMKLLEKAVASACTLFSIGIKKEKKGSGEEGGGKSFSSFYTESISVK